MAGEWIKCLCSSAHFATIPSVQHRQRPNAKPGGQSEMQGLLISKVDTCCPCNIDTLGLLMSLRAVIRRGTEKQ